MNYKTKRPLRSILFFLSPIFLFFSPILRAQENIFTISSLQESYDLNNHIYYITENDKTLSIQSILKDEHQLQFVPFSLSQKLDHNKAHWLKVIIGNQMQDSRILKNWKLFVGKIDLMEVYIVTSSGLVLESLYGGPYSPINNKSLKFGNKYNRVNLSLEDNYPINIYIKVEKITNKPIVIDLMLNQNDFYQSWDHVLKTRWEWIFLGFLVTMIVFNFCFIKVLQIKHFFIMAYLF